MKQRIKRFFSMPKKLIQPAQRVQTSKRHFFSTVAKIAGAAVPVALASGFPAPAIASGKKQWRMIMTWHKVMPGAGLGAVRLAERITRLSEGELEIKVYGGGELVPALGSFDAVSQGIAELCHAAPYYWMSKNRSSAFFCSVPGGLIGQEQNGWITHGGGQALWDEVYGEFGVKAFPAGNTGTQMGGWFNKELHELKDLRGLKMRIPGIGGEIFSRLGGSAQTIAPQELFTAMQSGVIDGLEWIGAWNDMSLGFHRVSKYYYGPAFQEGGAMLELMINKKAYEKLSPYLQRVVREACAAENTVMTAEYHANNLRAFYALKYKHGVDIRPYPKEIIKAFFKMSEQVLADTAKLGAINRRVYDSFSQYRKSCIQHSYFTEKGYMDNRLNALIT